MSDNTGSMIQITTLRVVICGIFSGSLARNRLRSMIAEIASVEHS